MKSEKTSDTEKQILDAARTVFLSKGLEGARMQEIADAAGINKALLHYYFRSKDQLFEKVFYEAMSTFFPAIRSILTSDKPLPEIIASFVEFYVGMLMDNPYLPGFIFHEMSNNKERLAGFVLHKENPIQAFIDRINTDISEGRCQHINARQFFVSMISLCIFPFIGKPMLSIALGLDEASFRSLMEERKSHIIEQLQNQVAV